MRQRAVRPQELSETKVSLQEAWRGGRAGAIWREGVAGVFGNTPRCVRRHFHPRPPRQSRINNLGDSEHLRGLKVFSSHQCGPCFLSGWIRCVRVQMGDNPSFPAHPSLSLRPSPGHHGHWDLPLAGKQRCPASSPPLVPRAPLPSPPPLHPTPSLQVSICSELI